MIVLFIPGFAETPNRLSPVDSIPEPAESGSKDLPDSEPYTQADSNAIYTYAVELAQELYKARGGDLFRADAGDMLWLIEALHGRILHFAKGHALPLSVVKSTVDELARIFWATIPRGKSLLHENWRLSDVEAVERFLPVACERVSVKAPEIPRPQHSDVTVTTTGDCVRLNIGGAESYRIPLDDIPTPLSLLRWVEHLGAKTWVTREALRAFVRQVAQTKGWNLWETPATAVS